MGRSQGNAPSRGPGVTLTQAAILRRETLSRSPDLVCLVKVAVAPTIQSGPAVNAGRVAIEVFGLK